jgi:hypothetical protein
LGLPPVIQQRTSLTLKYFGSVMVGGYLYRRGESHRPMRLLMRRSASCTAARTMPMMMGHIMA